MFTQEQQEIIHSTARRVRVLAFAGTGKTSTLVGYARARPNKRIVYVCYNKAIQLEAAGKFPTNVTCKTAHSLAFAVYGKRYAHKLASMRVGDVAEILRLAYPQAATVQATLNNFLYSADDCLSEEHLPDGVSRNDTLQRYTVLEGASTLWASMQDVRNQRVPMSHDGYLKLYGLSRPTIPGDHVLFDEAQDANGVIAGIILSHPGAICLTGDRHQAIYGFRGSLDVISDLQDAATFALTRSFRFGDGIARVANHLLNYLGETRRVVGSGHHATSKMQVDRSKPYAYIARTNIELIQAAIETLEQRLPVYYVGGVENARLGLIQDGYHLYRGQHELIEDRFIKKFASLPALSEYATAARDAEMALLSKIVLTYSDRIPSLLQQLRANAVDAIGSAQRILSTAHRSKGLEFDQVILASDYSDLMAGLRPIPIDRMDVQEVNLHYMAATRAMEALEVGGQLDEFVRYMERERGREALNARELAHESAGA